MSENTILCVEVQAWWQRDDIINLINVGVQDVDSVEPL